MKRPSVAVDIDTVLESCTGKNCAQIALIHKQLMLVMLKSLNVVVVVVNNDDFDYMVD